MNDSEKYIRSAASSVPSVTSVRTNLPPQYADRRHQYMAAPLRIFEERRAYLATDYVSARVQGIDPSDFFAWTETEIRLSDVSTQSVTAFDSKLYDNFKEVLFKDRRIEYIPAGAYIETMGSTWLVTNPKNMSRAETAAIIARCRAHYSYYDAYGNIRSEPLVVDRVELLSNRTEKPENVVLPEGYFNVKCQKNAVTERLGENQRIILGKYAYYITGFVDFIEEFTYDSDSAHVLNFTIRREEPQEYDDMANKIAGGLLESWGASLFCPAAIGEGSSAPAVPSLLHNGAAVEASDEVPLTWTFSSSDENVASVDENGTVTGAGAGEAVITAALTQNPDMTASASVTVTAEAERHIAFTSPVPGSIPQYASATLTAAVFSGGVETEDAPAWSFSGGTDAAETDVSENGKSCVIRCLAASEEPLAVSVSFGDLPPAVAEIEMEGY